MGAGVGVGDGGLVCMYLHACVAGRGTYRGLEFGSRARGSDCVQPDLGHLLDVDSVLRRGRDGLQGLQGLCVQPHKRLLCTLRNREAHNPSRTLHSRRHTPHAENTKTKH